MSLHGHYAWSSTYHRSVKKKSKTLPKPSNKPDDKNTKRRPSKQKKPRPYSCIVDDGR